MKPNITKEQKLNLYRKALRNIDNISATCGLCFLLQETDNSNTIEGNIYD